MVRTRMLILLGLFAPLALADVEFTSPSAGDKVTGGSAIDAKWKDSGSAPSISDLKSYQLFLCAGSNSNQVRADPGRHMSQPLMMSARAKNPPCMSLKDQGTFDGTNGASATVPVGFGASTPDNAYYLKMLSTATAGGTVINFSNRFSLSGMTGVFPPALVTDLKTVSGTTGPPTVNQVAGANAAPPAGGAAGPYTVPYTLQTGLTRYAPMQPQPPTKITAQSATPLWPTSGTTVATTFMAIPSIVTTLTQSPTFSTTTRTNTVAAAPQPSDDMAKFLARWKD
ncbi:MAG: hypothetical protein M1838_000093 [Thelocarpon superellum]|nr:MAG: hypothetical protein M1838_000093 [Thelocarpon superellum]